MKQSEALLNFYEPDLNKIKRKKKTTYYFFFE